VGIAPPDAIADFVLYLLTKTDPETFSNQEWNIRDWLSGKIHT